MDNSLKYIFCVWKMHLDPKSGIFLNKSSLESLRKRTVCGLPAHGARLSTAVCPALPPAFIFATFNFSQFLSCRVFSHKEKLHRPRATVDCEHRVIEHLGTLRLLRHSCSSVVLFFSFAQSSE